MDSLATKYVGEVAQQFKESDFHRTFNAFP